MKLRRSEGCSGRACAKPIVRQSQPHAPPAHFLTRTYGAANLRSEMTSAQQQFGGIKVRSRFHPVAPDSKSV